MGDALIDIGLSKTTWKDCVSVFLPEYLVAGTLVMCKAALPDKEAAIFEGKVIWSSKKKSYKGFETSIGIIAASGDDKDRLRKAMRK